jgi:hypothetical protein
VGSAAIGRAGNECLAQDGRVEHANELPPSSRCAALMDGFQARLREPRRGKTRRHGITGVDAEA